MRLNVLNTYVDDYSQKESVNLIMKNIEKSIYTDHVGINASKIIQIDNDPKLGEIIKNSKMINPDGISAVWVIRLFLNKKVDRVAGIDLMMDLIKEAERKGKSIYFLGAKRQIVKDMIKVLQQEYPKLLIAGYHHGYIKGEEQKVVKEIANKSPDMVFVGITSPYKEYFIYNYGKQMNASFVMGVGGSFDVVSGTIKRAPLWMQKSGLEWMFRFYKEPKRLWRRYLIDNFKFLKIILKNISKIKTFFLFEI